MKYHPTGEIDHAFISEARQHSFDGNHGRRGSDTSRCLRRFSHLRLRLDPTALHHRALLQLRWAARSVDGFRHVLQ